MTTTKYILKTSELQNFKEFCLAVGWEDRNLKGNYEVLRMKHPEVSCPLIVHRKLQPPEYLTTHGESSKMLRKFLAKTKE